jgi:hypothetical protein
MTARLHRLASDWIAATNRDDGSGLEALYAPNVELFGVKLPRHEAVERKRAVRAKHPGLEERILPPIEIDRHDAGEAVLTFTKQVREAKGAPRDFRAYLRVREDGGRYWITIESDLTSDRNLRFPTCEKLMTAILWDVVEHEHLNADMAIVEAGPELPRADQFGEFAPKYGFKVGRFNENGPRMEHRAWVKLDPKDGQIELQCPAYSSWDAACGAIRDQAETVPVKLAFQSDLRAHIPKVCAPVLAMLARAANP